MRASDDGFEAAIKAVETLRGEWLDVRASSGFYDRRNGRLPQLAADAGRLVLKVEDEVVARRNREFTETADWEDFAGTLQQHAHIDSATWQAERQLLARHFKAAELDKMNLAAQKTFGRKHRRRLPQVPPLCGAAPLSSLVAASASVPPPNRRRAKKACDAAVRRLSATLVVLENCAQPDELHLSRISMPLAVAHLA